MTIDCERCESRGLACGNCAAGAIVSTAIVSQVRENSHPGRPGAVTGPVVTEGHVPDLDPAELRALRVLANAGMIAPLRYAPRIAKAS